MDAYIIHPDSLFVQFWNITMAFCILFAVVYVPYSLAFGVSTNIGSISNGGIEAACELMQLMVDLYFFIDIFVEFRIAMVVNGELVQRTSTIAVAYLKSWFVLDFLSTFGSLGGRMKIFENVSLLSNTRIVKLLRILKLVRMAKLKQVMDTIDEVGIGHELKVAGKLLQLSMLTLLVTHLVGCGFYATTFCVDEEEDNWFSSYVGMPTEEWRKPAEEGGMTVASKYLQSLYWAYVTVTTVGYGDILPVTDAEKLYTICITFVGTAVFAYINGEVAALASNKNREAHEYHAKRQEVEEFVTHYHIPAHLRVKIKRYYQSAKETGAFVKQDQILSELPSNLRREVVNALQHATLSQIPIFRHMPPAVAQKVLFLFEPVQLHEGDTLFQMSQACSEIYLLQRGEVELQKKGSKSMLLGAGSSFGLVHNAEAHGNDPLIAETENGHCYTVRAVASTACSLMRVDKMYIQEICRLWPPFEHMGKTNSNLRLVRRSVVDTLDMEPQHWAFAPSVNAKVEGQLKNMKGQLKGLTQSQEVNALMNAPKQGESVRVVKIGALKGAEGTVDDPEWKSAACNKDGHQFIKVVMKADGITRKFLQADLEVVREGEGEGAVGGALNEIVSIARGSIASQEDVEEHMDAVNHALFGGEEQIHHEKHHNHWLDLLHKHADRQNDQAGSAPGHSNPLLEDSLDLMHSLERRFMVLEKKMEIENEKNDLFRQQVLEALAKQPGTRGGFE
jgi:CRP-like cAMP-binding protein